MQIDHSLKRNFPIFAEWILREIPRNRHRPRVWNAFLKYSQLTQTQAEWALLQIGTDPRIDIRILGRNVDGVYLGARWPRIRRLQDKIFISRKLCRKFERKQADLRAVEAYDQVYTAIILHEMVHWGDITTDRTGQPNKDIFDASMGLWYRDADVGYQFELEAFGTIFSRDFLR